MKTNHTFAIIAYKDSVFLEDCIRSLKQQSISSNIIICTSTPTKHTREIANKHGIEIKVNPIKGKANDWNFALSQAKTGYVTLAHHDDMYYPEFTKKLLNGFRRNSNAVIGFTDYIESFVLSNKKQVIKKNTPNLIVKRILVRLFFFFGDTIHTIFLKKLFLSFGDPICCPAVMFNKRKLTSFLFDSAFKINIDWDAWLQLSNKSGDFIAIKEVLLNHRIHEKSGTTEAITGKERLKEDQIIFRKIWPKFIADLLTNIYSLSYKGNNISYG
jgi:glycosyltransferase involved in cell wall biosynthesis